MNLELNPENCNLVGRAIKELSPNVPFTGNGVTYDSICIPEGYEIGFSKEEFETKLQELVDAKPWEELREERNRRLAQCDWVVIRSTSTATPIPEEWKNYMQSLRDLPANATDPENPVWPEAPN